MSVENITHGIAENFKITKQLKLEHLKVTLAADNYAITVDHPTVLMIDPAAATRDVILPLETSSKGLVFLIFNLSDAASEDIVVKNNADNATIATITTATGLPECGIFFCDGVTWRGGVLKVT